MKRHKLLNTRNERLFNRLFENQGLKHENFAPGEGYEDCTYYDTDGSVAYYDEKCAQEKAKKEEVTEGEACPKCGKSPCACGGEENEAKASEGIMAIHCPQCDALNRKDNKHCTNCGASLKGGENVEKAQDTE